MCQKGRKKALQLCENVANFFESKEAMTFFEEVDVKVRNQRCMPFDQYTYNEDQLGSQGLENARIGLLKAKSSLYQSEVKIGFVDDELSAISLVMNEI